jgi:hypothetical protein
MAIELVQIAPIVQNRTITVPIPVQSTRAGVIDERMYVVSLPSAVVTGIRTFLGVDQGNNGEYAIDVTCFDGRLYNRSMHKEAQLTYYDAWDRIFFQTTWNPRTIFIHTVAHQTLPATGNVQFEIVLETQ